MKVRVLLLVVSLAGLLGLLSAAGVINTRGGPGASGIIVERGGPNAGEIIAARCPHHW